MKNTAKQFWAFATKKELTEAGQKCQARNAELLEALKEAQCFLGHIQPRIGEQAFNHILPLKMANFMKLKITR